MAAASHKKDHARSAGVIKFQVLKDCSETLRIQYAALMAEKIAGGMHEDDAGIKAFDEMGPLFAAELSDGAQRIERWRVQRQLANVTAKARRRIIEGASKESKKPASTVMADLNFETLSKRAIEANVPESTAENYADSVHWVLGRTMTPIDQLDVATMPSRAVPELLRMARDPDLFKDFARMVMALPKPKQEEKTAEQRLGLARADCAHLERVREAFHRATGRKTA